MKYSNHPINLALRFFLELAALAEYAMWGWRIGEGFVRFLLAIGLPLVLAIIWGTFRVPNDPGKAPVPVPGTIRLLYEALYFGGAATCFFLISNPGEHLWAVIFTFLIVIHYLTSLDRVKKCLDINHNRQKSHSLIGYNIKSYKDPII